MGVDKRRWRRAHTNSDRDSLTNAESYSITDIDAKCIADSQTNAQRNSYEVPPGTPESFPRQTTVTALVAYIVLRAPSVEWPRMV